LTLGYAEALRSRNVAVNVTILGHNILLESIAMERLKEVASRIDAGRQWAGFLPLFRAMFPGELTGETACAASVSWQ
jgi:hypothetical protein